MRLFLGNVKMPLIKLADPLIVFSEELIEYSVNIENQEASLLIGSLYKHNEKWKFKAIGQGFSEGLGVIANKYNVNLNELSWGE